MAGVHLCLLRVLSLFRVSNGLASSFPVAGNSPALEIIQNKLQKVTGINICTFQSHGGFDC